MEPCCPADVTRLCDEALAHQDAARFDRAFELLEQARRMAPDSALVHYRIALYHGDREELDQALQALDKSLRLDPPQAKARNNRGSILVRLGRDSEAEQEFRQAIALDPTLSPPYLNLGHLLEQRRANREAIEVYERALALGLDPETFEQCRAVAAGAITRASPASWVRTTFDNFAPVFDVKLRELGYRMPEGIARRLSEHAGGAFDILDLGCGTGLCGLALRQRKRRLVGIDVSPKMLQHATDRGIYDETRVAEIQEYLPTVPDSAFDVVIAADVFVYIGALEDVFKQCARILRPGGWFAFSTEEQLEGDYQLRPSGRYAQSEAYIRRLSARDFEVRDAEAAIVRHEAGVGLNGRLFLLQRRSEAAA